MKKNDIAKKEPITEIVDDFDDEPEPKPVSGDTKGNDLHNFLVFVVVLLICAGAAYFAYVKIFMPLKYGPANTTAPVNTSYVYNNFEFNQVNGLWQTQVQVGSRLISVPLHYGPRQVRRIEIIGLLNSSFDEGPVYITFDPNDTKEQNMTALAASELAINLAQGINREVIAACATNVTEACKDRPIVDCGTEGKNVIYLMEKNETIVRFNFNCIILQGKDDQLVMATDRLIWYWYRVMKKDEAIVITPDLVPVGATP